MTTLHNRLHLKLDMTNKLKRNSNNLPYHNSSHLEWQTLDMLDKLNLSSLNNLSSQLIRASKRPSQELTRCPISLAK